MGETIFTLVVGPLVQDPSSGNTGGARNWGRGHAGSPDTHSGSPAQLIPTSTPSQFLRQAVAGAPRCVDPSALAAPLTHAPSGWDQIESFLKRLPREQESKSSKHQRATWPTEMQGRPWPVHSPAMVAFTSRRPALLEEPLSLAVLSLAPLLSTSAIEANP